MLIAEVLENAEDIDGVIAELNALGMHCLHCALAHGETLAQAAAVHGQSVDDVVAKINKYC
jgi:hybrid cluster-associated redox disulfide protein